MKNSIKWNGDYSPWPSNKTIKKAFDAKQGNSADMNILLIASLKRIGIEAYPVFLSTRKNGYISESRPSLSAFNYVIVNAVYEGRNHLLDASALMGSIDQLPTHCFNEKGFCIKDKKTVEWLSLMPEKSAGQTHRYEMKLGLDGTLEGIYKARYTNSEAMTLREKLADMKPEDIKQYWQKMHKGLTLTAFKIINLDSLSKPINIEASIKIEGKVQVTDKMIYLNPVFYDNITENPFKAETRKTPIHYDYIFNTDISVKIDLPEGYTIEELPKNTTLVLPDNSAKASINFIGKENQIELSSKIAITKPTFFAKSYLDLREWYNVVIAKQSEQIVLKKK